MAQTLELVTLVGLGGDAGLQGEAVGCGNLVVVTVFLSCPRLRISPSLAAESHQPLAAAILAPDPQEAVLQDAALEKILEFGEPKWYRILEAVVEAMQSYAHHGVNVNVDFYSGVIYHLYGIPRDLFVPLFTVGRVPEWTAQVLEQVDNNILIRPLTAYNGLEPREYVPMERRK